eukprot:2712776-Pyramimonas_sp.AAC.1
MAIMALRTVGGGALWPSNMNWKYPELVKLPAPRSQYEVCEVVPVATPAAESLRTHIQAPKAKPMPVGMRSSSSSAAPSVPKIP